MALGASGGAGYAAVEAADGAPGATFEAEGRALVASGALVVVVSRAWEFALPLALLGVWGGVSLRAPSALALATTLATTLCAPGIGRWADGVDRLAAVRAARTAQVLGTLASVFAVFAMGGATGAETAGGRRSWLGLCLAGAAVEKLGGVVTRSAPKKDWAPTLFDGDRSSAVLSRTTTALSNASQVGEILGPLLGATLIGRYGPVAGAAVVGAGAVALELPAQLVLDALYARSPALRAPRPPRPARPAAAGGGEASAWARFIEQPSGTALLAASFSCLFFTCLAPHGAVLTAYLATRRVAPEAIAAFRVFGAFAGIGGIYGFGRCAAAADAAGSDAAPAGAASARRVVALRRASGGALALQLASACGAAYACGRGALPAFMACVVGSRAGLYAYDVGYAELSQLLVDERDRGACQGAEAAMCGFAELALAAATLVAFSDPADFGKLAALSALFVGLALALFATWAALYHVHDHDHAGGRGHDHEHTAQQAKTLGSNAASPTRHVHVHYAGPSLSYHAHDHDHDPSGGYAEAPL